MAPLLSHKAWPSSVAIMMPLRINKGLFSAWEKFVEADGDVLEFSILGFLDSNRKRSSLESILR
jgi:hypothetical protein